jgi:hypothetical protein
MRITESRLRSIIREVLTEITALDSIGTGDKISGVTRKNVSGKVKNHIINEINNHKSYKKLKNIVKEFPDSDEICSVAPQFWRGSEESETELHEESFSIEITQRSSINGKSIDPDNEGNLCFYIRMPEDGVARSILNHFYIICQPTLQYTENIWYCYVHADKGTLKYQEDSLHGYDRKGRGSSSLDHEKLKRFN